MVSATPKPTALSPVVIDAGMTFPADSPGQVVAITDPVTGSTLLVGTQRVSGQSVLTPRRTSEFNLPVTGQGIVVEPLSDAIGLRITQTGFVLSGARNGLHLSATQTMDEATIAAARLTRLFEFPRQTRATMAERAKLQAVAAATSPLLQRGPPRRALAESLVGLGMGAEAATLLRITMKDDPREAASATTVGLLAIADLLAGRPNEAGDLADPRLTGSDEIAMWRAIQTAMTDEGSQAAAAVLATTAPLLFTYPPELRSHVLPLALETMILGGQANAAAPLLAQRAHDPELAYARALLKQAQGDNEGALKLFEALADSRSTFDHARAESRAVELRLTMGQLTNAAAADALDKQLYAWRGDGRELALRLRIAGLRQKDGNWRAVFTMLREARAAFPANATDIDRRLKEAFAAVPRDPMLDKMEPTELIALLDENAGLMADGPDGEPLRVLLADKLMALDLPKRADPLLTRLMRAAPYGPARAGFGATLATLRLREGDGDGAILALSESNSADMGDAVRARRALIAARVEAKRGDLPGAVEALATTHTQDADEERAAILERAGDWAGARDALTLLAARAVPDPCASPCGPLDSVQLGIVLRLATAATRAGDDVALTALRDRLGTRVGSGPQGDMFRLLTVQPVRGTADLGRARAEIGVARSVAADMGPRKPAARTP
jgi:tetratricopeptide (TPR) repeat protein